MHRQCMYFKIKIWQLCRYCNNNLINRTEFSHEQNNSYQSTVVFLGQLLGCFHLLFKDLYYYYMYINSFNKHNRYSEANVNKSLFL